MEKKCRLLTLTFSTGRLAHSKSRSSVFGGARFVIAYVWLEVSSLNFFLSLARFVP